MENKLFKFEGIHIGPMRVSVGRLRLQPGPAAVCLAVLLAVLLPSEWCAEHPVLLWVLLMGCPLVGMIVMYFDSMHMRPRKRWLFAAILLLVLAAVFLLMTVLFYTGILEDRSMMTAPFVVLSVLAAGAGVWCMVYWRRLCAEAQLRLRNLRQKRAKRNRKEIAL